MAVRYAVATGNWSDTATWNGGTLPTSSDDVYSNGFTVTIDVDVTVLSLRTTAQSPAVAGGGFICGSGRAITCTGQGIISGSSTVITFNHSSGSSSLNSAIAASQTTNFISSVVINSSGILNILGNLTATGGVRASVSCLSIANNANSVVNIVGNVLVEGELKTALIAGIGSTLNITGDVQGNPSGGQSIRTISATTCILTITGNILHTNVSGTHALIALLIQNGCTVNIIGNVIQNQTGTNTFVISSSGTANFLKIIGSISGGFSNPAIQSLSTSDVNLFTGPFICGIYGAVPFQVSRMHYVRTFSSYFEFRDETTNGGLPPGSTAPAARLVSPDTVVDAPVPANVRDGVTYALATLTGTLKVPSPDSVAKGVPTDNTVGNAVLTPDAVWDYATANLTDPNSIGARLKNVSTVDTTGEQLEALL